jgi:hypothetical protein
MRLVGLLLVACSGSPKLAPPPPPPPIDAAAIVPMPPPGPSDPPEPLAPMIECNFDRSVTCHDEVPKQAVLQPAPFEWCARVLAPASLKTEVRFSAAETRKARKADPDACCYIEFIPRECR